MDFEDCYYGLYTLYLAGDFDDLFVAHCCRVQEGVMGVHDEETKAYFHNTGVRCVLAPRYADHRLSWFRQQVRELWIGLGLDGSLIECWHINLK